MTPERWHQIKTLVIRAMQVPLHERAVMLDSSCGGDVELRAEVESFLSAMPSESAAGDSLDRVVGGGARAFSLAKRDDEVDALRAALQVNLGTHYEILSTLGVGGMGAVFLARERALDRQVAIKVLRLAHAMAPGSQDRFRREARIAAQLSHASILPLHACGEVAGMWYLVMEYVRGPTLAQRLHDEGRLPVDEARQVFRALSDALVHAHERQVIHRDIKPANILIDAERARPLLMDFGISKMLGDADGLTDTGVVIGTPQYMAPEQFVSTAATDARSDLFALGTVAYEMLTGRATLADVRSAESLTNTRDRNLMPAHLEKAGVPADLTAVIVRCLATRPAERWSDARALRDAIDRVSPATDVSIPPALREVAGYGAYATVWVGFWLSLVPDVGSTGRRVLLLFLATCVPFGLGLEISRVSAPSINRAQFARVLFWPPLWWSLWWPPMIRRTDDVWSRLPTSARGARSLLSVLIGLAILSALNLRPREGTLGAFIDMLHRDALPTLLTLGTVLLLVAAGIAWWARRWTLASLDALHFFVGATADSTFWSRRDIGRRLRPRSPGVRPPERDTPSDYVRAIMELERVHGDGGSSAHHTRSAMAHQLLAAITACDERIAVADRDVPEREVRRVTERIAALESASNSHETSDTREALIALVRNELAMLQELRAARAAAMDARLSRFDALKALWRESVRSDGADDTPEHDGRRVSAGRPREVL